MCYRCLNCYRNNPCDETRVDMVQTRSSYTNTIRKKKWVYDKEHTHTLESARFTNANMLRSSVSKKSKCNLTSRDFQTYFKSVNDPESTFYQPDDDVLYCNDRYLNGELDVMFTELNLQFTTEDFSNMEHVVTLL